MKLFIYFIVLLIFVIKGIIFVDPDFGWHLRFGNTIMSSGIPATDPYSYTMKSFPLVGHEWSIDVGTAVLYPLIGDYGLSLIYALLALVGFLISLSVYKTNSPNSHLLSLLLLLTAAGAVVPFEGIRPQVLSWLMLALLLKIIFSLKQKFLLICPFMFLLWVNIHGSFALGIVVLFLFWALQSLRTRTPKIFLLLIFVLSSTGTLINPYGLGIWREVLMTVTDSNLRWRIAEWMPSFFDFNPFFLFLIALSSLIIIRHRKKYVLEKLGLYLFFLFQAVASLRNIPLFVIFSLPIVLEGIDYLFEEIKDIKYGIERFDKFFKYFFYGTILIFTINSMLLIRSYSSLKEDNYYPQKAIRYLKTNPLPGELFSSYNWGGYLIWKLPENKVFIDGRMPSWRWEGVPGESKYVMDDYVKILEDKLSYKDIFKKYNIDTVLWANDNRASWTSSKLEKKIQKLFGINNDDERGLIKRLIADGWVKTYEDSVSVIYRRPN